MQEGSIFPHGIVVHYFGMTGIERERVYEAYWGAELCSLFGTLHPLPEHYLGKTTFSESQAEQKRACDHRENHTLGSLLYLMTAVFTSGTCSKSHK
jgi:hypothetical protein